MPSDPLQDLADFDWEAFAQEAEAAAGDEGRALAENVARNLAESIRQQRNALEAAADAPKTGPELSDETDLAFAPGNERNIQASFENHLKGLFRRTGEALRQKIESQEFMGFMPGQPAVRLSLAKYTEENLSNLGPHPHSEKAAAPIPPGYEAEAAALEKIGHLSPKAQARWIGQFQEAKAQGKPAPEIPE